MGLRFGMGKPRFRGYDKWKLSNREDEEDAANARHRRELAREERADEDRDREKDEKAEMDFDENFPSEEDLG